MLVLFGYAHTYMHSGSILLCLISTTHDICLCICVCDSEYVYTYIVMCGEFNHLNLFKSLCKQIIFCWI